MFIKDVRFCDLHVTSCDGLYYLFKHCLPLFGGLIPIESLPGEGVESVSFGLITYFGQYDMCLIQDNALRAIPPFFPSAMRTTCPS